MINVRFSQTICKILVLHFLCIASRCLLNMAEQSCGILTTSTACISEAATNWFPTWNNIYFENSCFAVLSFFSLLFELVKSFFDDFQVTFFNKLEVALIKQCFVGITIFANPARICFQEVNVAVFHALFCNKQLTFNHFCLLSS